MSRDDEPMDTRLKAALAHAPDRDLLPPAGLGEAILRQAARAARPAAAPSRPSPWRWIDRLLQPAPAAALATLVLGSTVLLLWRGEVPPEALPGGAPAADLPAPATPTPAPASAPPATAPAAALDAAAPAAATAQRSRPLPQAQAHAEPSVAHTKAAPGALPAPAAAHAPEPTPAPVPAPVRAPEPATPAAAPDASAPAQAPAAAAAAAAPPAPVPAAPPTPAAGTDLRVEASPPRAMARALRDRPDRPDRPDRSADPVAALMPRLAGPSREAAATLQQAAAGRWQPSAEPMPADAHVLRDADQQPLARAHLAADHVLWQAVGAGAGVWRAELAPTAVAALRERWGGGLR